MKENATSTLLWTIHRPLRGWYIRICAPSFPSNTYISLLPVPRSSPYHATAALTFSCRTAVPRSLTTSPTVSSPPAPAPLPPTAIPAAKSQSSLDSDATLSMDDPSATKDISEAPSPYHTYPPPPTPPIILVSPPSPSSVRVKLAALTPPTPITRPTTQITNFLLAPHAQPQIPEPDPENAGFFARALRVFKNNAPTQSSSSFTLCPIPPPMLPPAPTPAGTSSGHPHMHVHPTPPSSPDTPSRLPRYDTRVHRPLHIGCARAQR
ncbi:hypothetical protein EW146_g6887 [Bondarzewia mesenterica]|uniref:Uncharacterized protein n=1 Tax=Bondarzewia mesenterica TaxID=1095465 RepID=A0A4S4LP86_9AGAM|nr:hypothetical protein EW146_g6887 [Bondarzewia mesenterica]